MLRVVLALCMIIAVATQAAADQVLSVETGAPGAVICSGTPADPARYGAMRADAEGRAALFFPTLDSNLRTVSSYKIHVESEVGGAAFQVRRSDLPDLAMPALDPTLSASCGVTPGDAEQTLSLRARAALRRLSLDGWPYGIAPPAFAFPLSIRLADAREDGALTPGALCPEQDQACLTNAAVARHQACCTRYPDGEACREGQRSRICRAEYEAVQDRYAGLFRWASPAGAPRCAPAGTVLPQSDISQCCAERYRALTEAEAVLVFATLAALETEDGSDWAELFVCDPQGNRYDLGP